MATYTVGIDFGTASGRAVLVDVPTAGSSPRAPTIPTG